MDNQYNYYDPEQNTDSYNYQNTGDNQFHSGGPEQAPHQRPRKKTPAWVKAVCCGLAFGLVAGASFQAVNVVGNKLFGTEEKTQGSVKQTSTSSDTKLTTSSGSTVSANIAEISENAMPSIVSITNMSVEEVQSFFGGIQERQSESAGSGIIIGQNDSELLIATNNHVVEGNDTLTVTFIDEESVEANVKGTNAAQDLAVVAVNLDDIKESTMDQIAVATMGDSDKLKVGEPAIAIGNALGYGQSVTTGIISAKERTMEGHEGNLLQTDAAINPGNSGGALLNANGEVIGINTAKVAADTVEGMGYAIPISDASETITNLMNQETRTKVPADEQGYIGILSEADVSADLAEMYNMPTGVYVSEVVKGGGADKAGIEEGSIITAINGTSVDGMQTLQEQLQYYRVGETVTLTVAAPGDGGKYKTTDVEVTLGESAE
ncbi:trypsin-like peptidase domain-containing protein [uncultured Merdimonas sp.]|uniref:S1C family serine protease n=1 Tax=uncultured Merdimonas sp. TaxID=2023269 RepID=UPI00320A594A